MARVKDAATPEGEVMNESFVRWQGITLKELGYSVNLLLASATASLGFGFSFVKESEFNPSSAMRVVFGMSLLLLLVSVSVGLLCAHNRLSDFRKTRDIARDRERWHREGIYESAIYTRLSRRRDEVEAIGRRTWGLFYGQLWCFVGGVLLLIVSLAIVYRGKL